MRATGFVEARRLMGGISAPLEKRCLLWLAARLPRQVTSDHLTALALIAMVMTGLSFYLAQFNRLALLLVVAWLAINWFGDSLDGTVARVRQQQRPRYGFYVDHVVDCVGIVFLLIGLALSGFMSPLVAMGFLVAYLLLSAEVYLATYCLTEFRMSFWGVGPTELRILLAIGALALFSDPMVEIFDAQYRLFDVGGVIAIAGLATTMLVSTTRNVRALYRAERLPKMSA